MGDGDSSLVPCSGFWLVRRKANDEERLPEMLLLCPGGEPAFKGRSFLLASCSWLLVAAIAALIASFGVPIVHRVG